MPKADDDDDAAGVNPIGMDVDEDDACSYAVIG